MLKKVIFKHLVYSFLGFSEKYKATEGENEAPKKGVSAFLQNIKKNDSLKDVNPEKGVGGQDKKLEIDENR